ncbi:MAG TPA: hypothetical protein VMY99_03295 [Nevskiaceae bacterium]|nr:hypothetical protein [Nevskiaceae bacterium]
MARPTRLRSVDGFAHRRRPAAGAPPPATQQLAIAPVLQLQPAKRRYARPTTSVKRKRRLPDWLQYQLIIFGAMIAGYGMQSYAFGEVAVVCYGIAAFIWRVPSRTTFTLALLSMVATILLLVGRGNVALAQNFATFTFLFLVVGVITLSRELKKEGGRIYSRRTNNNQG